MGIAAAAVISGVISIGSGMWGSSKAKKAAKEAARLERLKTDLAVNNLRDEQRYTEGLTKARLANSGAQIDFGTPYFYMREQKFKHQNDIRQLRMVGASNAKQIQSEGNMRAKSALISGVGSGISQILGGLNT